MSWINLFTVPQKSEEYIDIVIYLHTISVISGIDDALDTPMVRIQSDTLENSVEEVYKEV
jgi:hypothetical protein